MQSFPGRYGEIWMAFPVDGGGPIYRFLLDFPGKREYSISPKKHPRRRSDMALRNTPSDEIVLLPHEVSSVSGGAVFRENWFEGKASIVFPGKT